MKKAGKGNSFVEEHKAVAVYVCYEGTWVRGTIAAFILNADSRWT
jgi:hypothetical protein